MLYPTLGVSSARPVAACAATISASAGRPGAHVATTCRRGLAGPASDEAAQPRRTTRPTTRACLTTAPPGWRGGYARQAKGLRALDVHIQGDGGVERPDAKPRDPRLRRYLLDQGTEGGAGVPGASPAAREEETIDEMPTALRPRPLPLAAALILALLGAQAAWAEATPDRAQGPHIAVRLVADRLAVLAGDTVRLGVLVRTDPDWHIYWKQPGDSGLPTKITWSLPPAFRASPLRWPVPRIHAAGPLVAYLYETEVLLPIEVQAPFDLTGETVQLAVDLDWLVCEDDQGCIPGQATLTLTLPVTRAEPARSAEAQRFDDSYARLPTPPPADLTFAVDGEGALITLPAVGPWQAQDVALQTFWGSWQLFDPLAAPVRVDADDAVHLRYLRYPFAAGQKPPTTLEALLVVGAGETRRAYELHWTSPAAAVDTPPLRKVSVQDTAESRVPLPPAFPTTNDDLSWATRHVEFDARGSGGSGDTDRSLLGALLLAFLGGMFLNVMPCVLPVLSLKILGFVDQAGSDPVRTRRHGYAFGAGVLGSFLLVAGLLLLVRSWGTQVGWGFQLQEPGVVAGLAILMFALGLNLAGVFEIGQGLTGLAGRAAQGSEGKGYLGSVWMGALATVIATPCTAPFMGPAIGYALTQPAVWALLVFAALGLGMAAPYVLLAVFPRWLRYLPKPGAWMVTLKQLMAFPMFATVIWLVWVFGRQVGSDAVVALLLGLLLLALGAWLYGRFGSATTPARSRWIAGRTLAAACAVAGVVLALSVERPGGAGAEAAVITAPEGWVPYDGHVIRAQQDAGRPVFLDFTADWCLTCKANEAAFLETDAVKQAFERHGVIAMQGDWTRRDERITKALAQLDRSSVPLYVIVPADREQPAVVLRTAITTGYVVDALDEVLGPVSH